MDSSASRLSSSEISFPRGGGSVLTPVELKSIANKATEDVLFEQKAEKRRSESSNKQPRKKQKKKTSGSDVVASEESVTVTHFSFKNMIPGAEVLGQVKEVQKSGLSLALGNTLVGFVALTNVSSEVNEQVEKYATSQESTDEEDDDNENPTRPTSKFKPEMPRLTTLFSEGQWLRAVVIEGETKKKSINLSIMPKKVNVGLERDDLTVGNLVQGSVKSIEDHGVVFTIGIHLLSGFLSKKELEKADVPLLKFSVGQVHLLSVAGTSGRSVSLRPAQIENMNKKTVVTAISSIDAILPGSVVNSVISKVSDNGVTARLFGMADASYSMAHALVFSADALKNNFAISSTVRARVIGVVAENGAKKFLLSRATNVLNLKPERNTEPSDSFPIGFIFEQVEVIGKDSEFIFVSTGTADVRGQVHKSQVDPDKEANIEYPIGSRHKARVLGYNEFDNLLRLTFNPVTIDSKFASPDDIPVGEYISSVEVVLILPEDSGVIVKIFGLFDAFVPMSHLSDIKLVYPERKFKVGSKFKGRVWNKRGSKLYVTLRRTLVNMEDDAVITRMEDLSLGLKTTGVVDKFVKGGVVVSFFNSLRAFLPNSEISESFVANPSDYLRENQAVAVRIMSFSVAEKKISVTLRQATELSDKQAEHLEEIKIGRTVVIASVAEKAKESVVIELNGSNLRGVVSTCQLSDGSYEESRIIYKSLVIGSLMEVIVLEKDFKNRLVTVSAKKSLINAAKLETFPVHYEDLHVGAAVAGYIKSVTSMGIFVRFGGRLTGLVLPRDASSDPSQDLLKLYYKDQSVVCEVRKIDSENKRFLLGLSGNEAKTRTVRLINPVDKTKKFAADYCTNEITVGVIAGFEGDHLKIRLADNLHGRIHASQCLGLWKSIENTLAPLLLFVVGERVTTKIIGFHNTKSHHFSSSSAISDVTEVELSSLEQELSSKKPYKVTALDEFEPGSEKVVYIARYEHGVAFVNVAPGVEGRVALYSLSSNVMLYRNFEKNFPIGAALRLKVLGQDHKYHQLVFSARETEIESVTQLKVGDEVAARIFRINEGFLLMELGKGVTALSDLHEALSDYDQTLTDVFKLDQAVIATVSSVDEVNQKVTASLRDDKNAKDKFIKSIADLKRGDLVKGFVKSVADVGLHVALGRNVSALVRVSDISDGFLTDWKKYFRPNQCVLGKISQCKEEGRILMTLKESEVNGDLTSFKTFDELEAGQNYDGSVKLVTDFGVFVKLDGTANVSGLCHRSEISDNVVENVAAIFGVGDRVKVKILKIDSIKKQLSLGMKASYFTGIQESADSDSDVNLDKEDQSEQSHNDNDDSEQEDVDEDMVDFDDREVKSFNEEESSKPAESSTTAGLSTNGFDWTASILDQVEDDESSDEDAENFMESAKRKRKHKKKPVQDKTGEINTRAPQSVGDFERLLVGNPNSSILWMNYMSFQLQLGEVDKSREIAERSLKTINYRDEEEKLNMWIAILNLENSFGTDESLDEAFKRAVQYMDSLTVHQKLIGIFQLSEKFDKAEQLFKVMTKKFSQNVGVWVLNGSFYLKREMPDEAHQVLARALQSLPKRDHIEIVRKFGQLEFAEGDQEQGRSLFEGLIADAPKRIDLWNVYIDQEIKKGERDRVEALFERVVAKKLSKKQAKFFFSKWLSFVEERSDEQAAARVKALAVDFVQKQSQEE